MHASFEVEYLRVSSVGPGLHDFGWEHYLSDPCPRPSLDSRGIRLLLEASPAHYAAVHPKLTRWPDQLRLKQRDESLGSIVRCLVLNLGHEIAALPFDDWTTKLAQLQRRQAREDGKIPATRSVFDSASAIADIARIQLARELQGGVRDATLIWRRMPTADSIWCRERVDAINRDGTALVVQTVGRAANDREIARAAQNSGLDVKVVWLLEGLFALGRGASVLVVTIETEPPYTVSANPLGEPWVTETRARIDLAATVFKNCLAARHWPVCVSGSGALARQFDYTPVAISPPKV